MLANNKRYQGIALLSVLLVAASGSYAAECCAAKCSFQSTVAGPVRIAPPQAVQPASNYKFDSPAGPIVAQTDEQSTCWSWGTVVEEGTKRTFKPAPYPTENPKAGVKVEKVADNKIEVSIDGQFFTAFNYGKNEPKPYLWPVIGPYGDAVTRAYPMKEFDFERQDHWHHRSIWCAWGDIRSEKSAKPTNYWHQTKDPADQDRQVVTEILETVSGPVFGLIKARVDWVTHEGKREFSEVRTYTFFRGDGDNRIIDVQNAFSFDDCDVTFASTKEAGIVSVRIATSMDEIDLQDRKKPGKGQMCNSRGQKKMAGCWGQKAEWCDYVGPVEGKTIGISIFDNPKNMNYPCRWHIRNYGLFAANPIAVKPFIKPGDDASAAEKKAYKELPSDDKTWKKGESETFNYRILIHKGDTEAAKVVGQHRLYVAGSPAAVN